MNMAKAKKKVWVKILVSMAGPELSVGSGAVIQIEKEEAQRLISAGLAEATTAPKETTSLQDSI